jgi:hypothetical protein
VRQEQYARHVQQSRYYRHCKNEKYQDTSGVFGVEELDGKDWWFVQDDSVVPEQATVAKRNGRNSPKSFENPTNLRYKFTSS